LERTLARIARSCDGGNFASVSRVYEPIGTDSDPTASFTPSAAASSIELIFESCGTASTSSLVANSTGCDSRPSSCSSAGRLVLAAANTSGSTPWRICAASSSEPANWSRTVASLKAREQVVSASVIEAAADTTSRASSPSPSPQPASASTRIAPATPAALIRAPPSPRSP
jgi:hypothetical protein